MLSEVSSYLTMTAMVTPLYFSNEMSWKVAIGPIYVEKVDCLSWLLIQQYSHQI